MINNKKIVLTGANSGIGLEVLKLLVKGDNKILAVDLHTDKLETFDKEKVVPMVMDVSKKENVDLIFDRAIEVLGDIDIFYVTCQGDAAVHVSTGDVKLENFVCQNPLQFQSGTYPHLQFYLKAYVVPYYYSDSI